MSSHAYVYWLGMFGGFALGVAFVVISWELNKRKKDK